MSGSVLLILSDTLNIIIAYFKANKKSTCVQQHICCDEALLIECKDCISLEGLGSQLSLLCWY